MGASGWDYRAPYAGSVEATLIAVQEQVLVSGDYIWPWDDIDPEYLDEDEVVPRPSSLAGLAAAKEKIAPQRKFISGDSPETKATHP